MVIAGDHIDAFLPVPIAALSASFAAVARKSRLLACSGNHDFNARNAEGEKTVDWLGAVRSSVLAVDGDTGRRRRHAVHGVPLVGPPACPARRGAPAGKRLATAQQPVDWVYHAPPEGH